MLKTDIEDTKTDIEKCLANIDESVRNKTVMHVVTLL